MNIMVIGCYHFNKATIRAAMADVPIHEFGTVRRPP